MKILIRLFIFFSVFLSNFSTLAAEKRTRNTFEHNKYLLKFNQNNLKLFQYYLKKTYKSSKDIRQINHFFKLVKLNKELNISLRFKQTKDLKTSFQINKRMNKAHSVVLHYSKNFKTSLKKIHSFETLIQFTAKLLRKHKRKVVQSSFIDFLIPQAVADATPTVDDFLNALKLAPLSHNPKSSLDSENITALFLGIGAITIALIASMATGVVSSALFVTAGLLVIFAMTTAAIADESPCANILSQFKKDLKNIKLDHVSFPKEIWTNRDKILKKLKSIAFEDISQKIPKSCVKLKDKQKKLICNDMKNLSTCLKSHKSFKSSDQNTLKTNRPNKQHSSTNHSIQSEK